MNRKKVCWTLGGVLLLLTGVIGVVVLLALHVPDFYRRAEVAPGPDRKLHSKQFQTDLVNLFNGIRNETEWGTALTDEQMNSYFAEDFVRPGSAERTLLPERVSQPRVIIEADRIRLGARYGSGWWSAILSVDLRVWLVANEPNVVAVEIERLRAGYLPISTRSFLDRLSEVAHRQDIEVTWYRHNGKPVALLHFPGRREANIQLLQLKLDPGKLTISGADRSRPGGEVSVKVAPQPGS